MLNTLDPPGSIAILGGGPLGLEAALYGRYLGYQVTLFEADQLASNLRHNADDPPPHPCVSPLGLAAIAAQQGQGRSMANLEPGSIADWIADYLEPLTRGDLLKDRVHTGRIVTRVKYAPEEALEDDTTADEDDSPASVVPPKTDDDGSDDDGPLPPDFLIYTEARCGAGEQESVTSPARFEAVIDARGLNAPQIGPAVTAGDSTESNVDSTSNLPAYYFLIGRRAQADCDYVTGLAQIQQLYAALYDRPDLNVYANLGG